jgi:sugar phosphate isomerase/epimerase
VIKEGYRDLIDRAKPAGIKILFENHWGPTKHPKNVIKLLESIDGLGYLFDTHNWAESERAEGRAKCAKYADALHIKTFEFDAVGNETTADLDGVFKLLKQTGYKGAWGIESVPKDGDEYAGVKKTIALIKRNVQN